MGTRNLTMVISKGETKIAQYGQWDGYPSGQGATVLDFLTRMYIVGFENEFKNQLDKCKFIDKEKEKEIQAFLDELGCSDGWMNMDQSAKYVERYPLLSRDKGAEILNLVLDSEEETIWLNNGSEFAADSLFCEWAYVIDMDNRRLECYCGFNKEKVDESERFHYLEEKIDNDPKASGYRAIKHLKTFSFNALPEETVFVKTLEKLEHEFKGYEYEEEDVTPQIGDDSEENHF